MKKISIFLLFLIIGLSDCTPRHGFAQTSTMIRHSDAGEMQVIIPKDVTMEQIHAIQSISKDVLGSVDKAVVANTEIKKNEDRIDALFWWFLFMTPLVILALVSYYKQKQRTELARAQLQAQIFYASQRSLPGGSDRLAARLGLPIVCEDEYPCVNR